MHWPLTRKSNFFLSVFDQIDTIFNNQLTIYYSTNSIVFLNFWPNNNFKKLLSTKFLQDCSHFTFLISRALKFFFDKMTTMSKLKYVSITETQTKIYILCSGWVFGECLSGTSLKYLKFGNFDQQKGAIFFPASGVIFDAWPTIYFRIQPGFWSRNYLLGCPNIFIFMYLNFLLNEILCYDAPGLIHNST